MLIKIMDELFDKEVREVGGFENITDESITDALERMRQRGERVPCGELLESYEEDGQFFVFIED